MNQQIRYGSGGTLTFDPPQHGRPSSASVGIYTPGGSQHVDPNPSVTIDSVNTTITAGADEDDTTITVASATGIVVGRYYDLTASDGRVERIRVRSISGTTVTLAEGLGQDYASGSSITSNRLTCSIASGDADPLDEGYEARWTYTIGGGTHYANSLFDVVRSSWPSVILRPHEFRQFAPGLSARQAELTDLRSMSFSDDIEIATDRVRVDILSRGMRPDLFRSFDAFKKPVAMAVILGWAEDGRNIPPTWQDSAEAWLDTRREVYSQSLSEAMNVTRSYDADESGTVSESERTHRLGVLRWRL